MVRHVNAVGSAFERNLALAVPMSFSTIGMSKLFLTRDTAPLGDELQVLKAILKRTRSWFSPLVYLFEANGRVGEGLSRKPGFLPR